jgi:hypothetical protein
MGPGRDSPQPWVTTLGQQQHPTPPRGRLLGRHVARKGDVLQSIDSESGPPWESAGPLDIRSGPPGWSRTPTCTDRTPRMGSGPPPPPPYGVRTAHSGIPRPYLRPRRGSGADTCSVLLRCASDLSAYTPAPRSGGTPMLPRGILRGLSQRAEPSMTPLGYARHCIHYK